MSAAVLGGGGVPWGGKHIIITVVAPPSSVVKCLWEVFVWGDVLVVCVCVSVSGVLFSVGVCVCDLLIFLPSESAGAPPMRIE